MNNTLYFGYVTPTWKDGRKDYTFHYESIKVHETAKQYKVIEINPNLYLDLGAVIKKGEMDRAVFKAASLAEVGTTITHDMKSEARINIIKQVTERIEYLNGRIKARAEQGKRQSPHLISEIEDCANQLVALYQ